MRRMEGGGRELSKTYGKIKIKKVCSRGTHVR